MCACAHSGDRQAPHMLPHLFELFFQVDRARMLGQRGIGLALADALHGGGSIDALLVNRS